MLILSLLIISKEKKCIIADYNLSSYSFFQRGSIQEFLSFFSYTLAEKTRPGVRQAVAEDAYVGHAYKDKNERCGVVITTKGYPERAAFRLLDKIMEIEEPKKEDILKLMKEYSDPQAEPIHQVQKELDETKVILHKTIESILERGEKLDNLIEKSEHLGTKSKIFYKAAKQTNSCTCIII